MYLYFRDIFPDTNYEAKPLRAMLCMRDEAKAIYCAFERSQRIKKKRENVPLKPVTKDSGRSEQLKTFVVLDSLHPNHLRLLHKSTL